jgi:hypothetical protein
MFRAGLIVLAVMLGACRTGSVGQAPVTPLPLFGPVIGAEVIGGRADERDDVLLLAGGTDLVRIGLSVRRFSRVKLRIGVGEECWSLARLIDGSLWTLRGRRTLAQLGADGAIATETPLAEPHFGLFAAGDRLVFQRADFTPPGPALLAGGPGGTRLPWSAIVTRSFPSLARASVAALNMVTCGPTDSRERACWFPDEAAVSLVTDQGTTRHVILGGLEVVSRETLLTSDNPRRAVRDAYVDAGGAVWILSSGTPPPGAVDVAGGWVLARYGTDGAPKGLARLSDAARLILRVDARNVILLMSTGMIGQVPRW